MGIAEILRWIWLFSANKIKSSDSFCKQPTQLIVQLNSSLRHIIVTFACQKLALSALCVCPKESIFWNHYPRIIGAFVRNICKKIKTSLKFRPNDSFGSIMVQHFKRRNSPLKCVHEYPTTEKHQERFLKHGWNNVYVKVRVF